MKTRTSSSKAVGLALLLLLLAGAAAILPRSGREGFDGSRVRNPDAYLLDMERIILKKKSQLTMLRSIAGIPNTI